MILIDANVLVAAFRHDHPQHGRVSSWLDDLVRNDRPFCIPDIVWIALLRVVTNPRAFPQTSPIAEVLAFGAAVRASWGYIGIRGQYDDWASFGAVVAEADARGNLVNDAYLAAIAVEANCEIATFDRDFRRFAGVRLVEPFAA